MCTCVTYISYYVTTSLKYSWSDWKVLPQNRSWKSPAKSGPTVQFSPVKKVLQKRGLVLQKVPAVWKLWKMQGNIYQLKMKIKCLNRCKCNQDTSQRGSKNQLKRKTLSFTLLHILNHSEAHVTNLHAPNNSRWVQSVHLTAHRHICIFIACSKLKTWLRL